MICACGGSAASSPAAGDDGSREDDYATSDFTEDSVLPYTYAGDWLDPPRALAGIGQFDRLVSTVHDDAKCSTMVGVSAAIIGGRERFLTLVSDIERLRATHPEDLAITKRVRTSVTAKRLTPRSIHELTEAMVRAYKVEAGAYDGDISRMVKASGFAGLAALGKHPAELVASLAPGEVVPLATVADGEAHITLLWSDQAGVVRLYDSDDIHHSHVLPRGSALYLARIDDPASRWDLAEKFR